MRLITKSALARLAGCSPATVTRAVKTTLAATVVVDRVNVDHVDARRFIEAQRRRKGR